jgi:transcriptional regulator with XRE-family HTH domain
MKLKLSTHRQNRNTRKKSMPEHPGGARRNDCVTKDWVAVATAIDRRLTELGWRQRQLAERSNVSQAIVRELHRRTFERRRSPRTLEALSLALHWHPQHLHELSNGRRPPEPDKPDTDIRDTLWSRLDSLEETLNHRLDDITTRIDELKTNLEMVANHQRIRGLDNRLERC